MSLYGPPSFEERQTKALERIATALEEQNKILEAGADNRTPTTRYHYVPLDPS